MMSLAWQHNVLCLFPKTAATAAAYSKKTFISNRASDLLSSPPDLDTATKGRPVQHKLARPDRSRLLYITGY